jgi:molybdopterin synthase catalytic subunit
MAHGLHGILLTGGSSSRMGREKATIEVDGEPLARRLARILAGATELAVEVGPGWSGLPSVTETPAGAGPLAAVVAGSSELVRRSGEKRATVVLASDLPDVSPALVELLVAQPGAVSAVPVRDGRPQPLCARWSVADLERAAAQLAAGERSLRHVFGPDAVQLDESAWGPVAPGSALDDVDTPVDLARRALAPPPGGDQWIGLGRHTLPTEAAVAWATLPRCGAVVTFMGTVRDHAEGRVGVEELEYEAYEEPALQRMGAVVEAARAHWPALERVAVLHRLGRLAVGETAVTVVVSSGHRADSLAAGAFLIDTVKETVPIWKHERWRDGEGWGTDAQPVRSV